MRAKWHKCRRIQQNIPNSRVSIHHQFYQLLCYPHIPPVFPYGHCSVYIAIFAVSFYTLFRCKLFFLYQTNCAILKFNQLSFISWLIHNHWSRINFNMLLPNYFPIFRFSSTSLSTKSLRHKSIAASEASLCMYIVSMSLKVSQPGSSQVERL